MSGTLRYRAATATDRRWRGLFPHPARYLLAASLLFALAPASGQAPRKIEILFLGHNSQHHNSAKYAPMLKEALASENFNFTYTADPNDLNEANLAKYDEVLI